MCYDAAFKLKVINFAKGMNNSSAAREFGVVREWQKAEVMLSKMPKTKCANCGENLQVTRTEKNHDRMGESAAIIWVYCHKTNISTPGAKIG